MVTWPSWVRLSLPRLLWPNGQRCWRQERTRRLQAPPRPRLCFFFLPLLTQQQLHQLHPLMTELDSCLKTSEPSGLSVSSWLPGCRFLHCDVTVKEVRSLLGSPCLSLLTQGFPKSLLAPPSSHVHYLTQKDTKVLPISLLLGMSGYRQHLGFTI